MAEDNTKRKEIKMELVKMYPPQKDSPSTFLVGGATASDTTLNVAAAAILPQKFPYPLTIGIDKTATEVVMVTASDNAQNRLTVTRGSDAKTWDPGTKVARVFNAADLEAVQKNTEAIFEETQGIKTKGNQTAESLTALTNTVGDSGKGLVKALNDEVERAKKAEGDENTRATKAETALNGAKIAKTDFPQVLTDLNFAASPVLVNARVSRKNATNNQTSHFTRLLPLASSTSAGIIDAETFKSFAEMQNSIQALRDAGGRFIGQSFPTKAALASYSVPPTVKSGDFTYVIDDESHQGATTRYVYSGTKFDFAFVVNYDPVGVATASQAGLVKLGNSSGKLATDSGGAGFIKDGAYMLSEVITINPSDWSGSGGCAKDVGIPVEFQEEGMVYFGLYGEHQAGVDPPMERTIRRAKITCDFDGSQYIFQCRGAHPVTPITIKATLMYKL